MLITLIVASAKNGVIGKDNRMIWRLSDDMKRFCRLTSGHHVLMGRKTFVSLGKALKDRVNLVITRNSDFHAPDVEVFPSIKAAMAFAELQGEDELFVIGGGEIYKELLPEADRIYLTRVLAEPQGDTFFPDYNSEDWLVVSEEVHKADEKNDHDFIYLDLERRSTKNAGVSSRGNMGE